MFKSLAKPFGFTITEVIVAAVVFAIATAGLLATVSALRQPSAESDERITAAFLGKEVLDNLRLSVDATTWDSGSLAVGNYTLPTVTINGTAYVPNYEVTADPGGSSARRVTLNVTW